MPIELLLVAQYKISADINFSTKEVYNAVFLLQTWKQYIFVRLQIKYLSIAGLNFYKIWPKFWTKLVILVEKGHFERHICCVATQNMPAARQKHPRNTHQIFTYEHTCWRIAARCECPTERRQIYLTTLKIHQRITYHWKGVWWSWTEQRCTLVHPWECRCPYLRNILAHAWTSLLNAFSATKLYATNSVFYTVQLQSCGSHMKVS